jgi:hypothetical protein
MWLSSSLAWAGDPALAEQLFNDGLALMDEGKATEACEKFAASMEAEPSGGAALNLGRCHEDQGMTATAWASYKRAATLFVATNEGDRKRFAQEQVARLEPNLSKLTIEVPDVEGLVVTRNGESVPVAAFGTAVPVDPGEQQIEASAPGYEPVTVTVVVGADGATETATIPRLTPAPAGGGDGTGAPGSDEGGLDPLVLSGGILLGVGGVAVIAGGVVGGLVLSDAGEARDLCGGDNTCDGGTQDGAEALDLADSAKSKAVAADVLIIGGAVVAAGGAVLLVLGLTGDDTEPATGLRFAPWVSPRTAGLQLGGSF